MRSSVATFSWNIEHKPVLVLLIPLALSAFTHLWNPIGFPDIFYDEGVYMRRAMHVLTGQGPQEVIEREDPYYDHPYFGQLFLAAALGIIGYPSSLLHTSADKDVHSIEMLYMVPRVLMGLLAVVDTFLIYKITQVRYNSRNIALIASILFAVMPISWLTRRILLEPIQLPFLLSSILFATLYYNKKRNSSSLSTISRANKENKNIPLILLSGIFLGLAIFTKIPAFTMIPLVGFLIISAPNIRNNNNTSNGKRTRPWKELGFWFIPVILIPAIWPAYSLSVNQFTYWLDGIFYQTSRGIEGEPLRSVVTPLFMIDPVILILGLAGLVFAGIKRDFFLLLWAIPYVIFLYMIGYVSYFHIIPLIPFLCIASARLIMQIQSIISRRNKEVALMLPIFVTSAIAIFGLLSTAMLITTNISSQFETAAFVAGYLQDHNSNNADITLLSSPAYSWIFTYIYNYDHVFSGYRDLLFRPIETDKVLLIADSHFKSDSRTDKQLATFLKNTDNIVTIRPPETHFTESVYPYTNMAANLEGNEQEIRLSRPDYSACITYDKSKRLISVTCVSSNLAHIDQYISNYKILHKESSNVWFLNANLLVETGATLFINNTDTSWLKINSTDNHSYYYILARGNLIIDSVKITSWDSNKNNYVNTNNKGTSPRSFILVKGGTGTTNVTNSELAYLGYDHANSFGLTYYTGAGSIIKNNKIHDLWYGFYSHEGTAHDIKIEGNEFYNNSVYGIDPHSGTHDLSITNNKVYNNAKHGIICSINCYDIHIKSNQVFNNTQVGIMLDNNVSHSVIAGNIVYDNKGDQITIQASSHNNQIYGNKISGGESGIRITQRSSNNIIRDNTITNSSLYGIYVLKSASDNLIASNTIKDAAISPFYVEDTAANNNNIFKNNAIESNNNISNRRIGL